MPAGMGVGVGVAVGGGAVVGVGLVVVAVGVGPGLGAKVWVGVGVQGCEGTELFVGVAVGEVLCGGWAVAEPLPLIGLIAVDGIGEGKAVFWVMAGNVERGRMAWRAKAVDAITSIAAASKSQVLKRESDLFCRSRCSLTGNGPDGCCELLAGSTGL